MGDNFKDYMAEQTRERNKTDLESALSRGHRREPKEMNVRQIIWKLIKLWFKHGNLPVRTWVQYQGWCDLYEPEYEGHIFGEGKFISIY